MSYRKKSSYRPLLHLRSSPTLARHTRHLVSLTYCNSMDDLITSSHIHPQTLGLHIQTQKSAFCNNQFSPFRIVMTAQYTLSVTEALKILQ